MVVKYLRYYYTYILGVVFMNTSIGDVVRPDILIAGAGELKRRPIWPAFVMAFAIATTLLWTGILAWLLFRMTAFLIT
jgi:hypothetical protein